MLLISFMNLEEKKAWRKFVETTKKWQP